MRIKTFALLLTLIHASVCLASASSEDENSPLIKGGVTQYTLQMNQLRLPIHELIEPEELQTPRGPIKRAETQVNGKKALMFIEGDNFLENKKKQNPQKNN